MSSRILKLEVEGSGIEASRVKTGAQPVQGKHGPSPLSLQKLGSSHPKASFFHFLFKFRLLK